MASSRLLSLRALKRPLSAPIPRFSFSSTQPVHSRHVHASAAQYAKKKKQKGTAEDNIFDESDDEEDLFGSSTSSSKSFAKPTTTNLSTTLSSTVPKGGQKGAKSKEVKLSKEQLRAQEEERKKAVTLEAQRLEEERIKDQERAQKLAEIAAWVKTATGEAGKELGKRSRQEDLLKLMRLTKTKEEWQNLIGMLRQWRIYPGETLREAVEHAIFERAIVTQQAALLIPILEYHPVYGLSLPTPSKARALLKAIVSPVGTYSPSYSGKEPTPEETKERLDNALRLTRLFSSISLQASVHYSSSELSNPAADGRNCSKSTPSHLVSLSPSKDFVSGPILISALLRVASTTTEPEQYLIAAQELASSLIGHLDSGSATSSSVKQELNWASAALNECQKVIDSGIEVEGLKRDIGKLRKRLEKEMEERREANLKRIGISLGGKRITSDGKGELIGDTLGVLGELRA